MRYTVKESELFENQYEVVDTEQGYMQIVCRNKENAEKIAEILNEDWSDE